jgi:uncharacterized protein
MESTLFLKTKKNNCYLYDNNTMFTLLCHPDFKKNIKKENTDYYKAKYNYLTEHGFFAKSKNAATSLLDESIVKEGIIKSQQIVFEVTDKCNLQCKYCAFGAFYESHDERQNKNLNINDSIKLLQYIFSLKGGRNADSFAIGFYGGEPLLNISFIKTIVNEVNKINTYKIPIRYLMTTNASLLQEHMDFLVDNSFRLLISLDGDEFNHSYRTFKNGINSFTRVIKNVDALQQKYPNYFKKQVSFNAVLHDRNSIKSINDFISNRYEKRPKISQLNDKDIKVEEKKEFAKMYHLKSDDLKLNDELLKSNIDLFDITSYSFMSNFLNFYTPFAFSSMFELFLKEKTYFPTCTCLPFSKKIYYTINNKLLPCERVNYKYSFGKIENGNVLLDTKDITEQYNQYYRKIKNYCNRCYAYKFCGICLFSVDNLDSPNPSCKYFYKKKRFTDALASMLSLIEANIDNYNAIRNATINF